MEILLPPILAAIRRLESAGITVDTTEGKKVVRGKLLMGVFDLPVKASATNMKQYNGKYGCNYCIDEGELIAKNTRIYPPDAPHHKRTASQIEQWAEDAQQTVGHSTMGVKGKSACQ